MGAWCIADLKGFWRTLVHFPGATLDISHTAFWRVAKFGSVRGLANQHLFSEFRELWSRCSAVPCGDMHQSLTDALV